MLAGVGDEPTPCRTSQPGSLHCSSDSPSPLSRWSRFKWYCGNLKTSTVRSKYTERRTPAPVSTKIFCDSLRSRSTWSRRVTSGRRLWRGGSDSKLSIIFHSVRLSSSSGRSVSCGTIARSTCRGSAPVDIWRYTQAIGPSTIREIFQNSLGKLLP